MSKSVEEWWTSISFIYLRIRLSAARKRRERNLEVHGRKFMEVLEKLKDSYISTHLLWEIKTRTIDKEVNDKHKGAFSSTKELLARWT